MGYIRFRRQYLDPIAQAKPRYLRQDLRFQLALPYQQQSPFQTEKTGKRPQKVCVILLCCEAGNHNDQRRLRINRAHPGQGDLRDAVVDYLQLVGRTDSPLLRELALEVTYINDAGAERAGEAPLRRRADST